MATAHSSVSCPVTQQVFPFNSRFIRVSQCAKWLGVSETQVRLICDSGQIKTIRTFNGHRRIDAHSCYEYATGLTVQEATESPHKLNPGG